MSYVNLDETNGGILLNVSEGGLAVQAAMNVMEDTLPHVRLQIPRSKTWLEGSARVVWTSDSRKTVGIEFQQFPEDARKQLRDWLESESTLENYPTVVEVPPPESELEASLVDGEARKLLRAPKATAPPVFEAVEFDLSTLLVAPESAPIELVHAVTPAVERSGLAPIESGSEPLAAPADATRAGNLRSRYAPLIATLAVLSLAAGWEAGRGNMLQAFFGIFQSSSAAGPSTADGSSPRGAINPATLSFLVVDANNQSWLVPFAGPASAPPSAPIPAQPPPNNYATTSRGDAVSTNARRYQQWALPAPQASGRRNNIQPAAAAPQLPVPQGNGVSPLPGMLPEGIGAIAPPTSAYSSLTPVTVVRRIDPAYPPAALQQRIEGTVRVHAHISENGAISDVTALSGSPLLAPAAVAAVKKWVFKPEILDGRAIASDFDVNIRFSLPQ